MPLSRYKAWWHLWQLRSSSLHNIICGSHVLEKRVCIIAGFRKFQWILIVFRKDAMLLHDQLRKNSFQWYFDRMWNKECKSIFYLELKVKKQILFPQILPIVMLHNSRLEMHHNKKKPEVSPLFLLLWKLKLSCKTSCIPVWSASYDERSPFTNSIQAACTFSSSYRPDGQIRWVKKRSPNNFICFK